MNTAATPDELRALVDRAVPLLFDLSDRDAAAELAPGKWSRKEVIGHLIDSATNNHGRFVAALLVDHLEFPGYDQDAWVRAQRYIERPWVDVIELWRALNLQIEHVMRSTPAAVLEQPRRRHNLHQVAWAEFSAGEPATLGWFHADYVGHMRHHLRQALGPDSV